MRPGFFFKILFLFFVDDADVVSLGDLRVDLKGEYHRRITAIGSVLALFLNITLFFPSLFFNKKRIPSQGRSGRGVDDDDDDEKKGARNETRKFPFGS